MASSASPASDLAEKWRGAGIRSGDVLLIHSDTRRTIRNALKSKIRLTPDILVNSFLEAVGETGTVLFPLFNFDFTKGIPFDIKTTPSQMGAMTEAARLRPDAVRTGHPIYSFAVIGANADLFSDVDNRSGYGADSPFGILRKLNGTIASLDLPDQNSMTFYHHVEEMCEVDYRYFKTFTGDYTDINDGISARSYDLFVRDIEKGVLTHVDPAGELMWDAGLYSGDRPKTGSGLRTINANAMFDFVSDIITSGKALDTLYKVNLPT